MDTGLLIFFGRCTKAREEAAAWSGKKCVFDHLRHDELACTCHGRMELSPEGKQQIDLGTTLGSGPDATPPAIFFLRRSAGGSVTLLERTQPEAPFMRDERSPGRDSRRGDFAAPEPKSLGRSFSFAHRTPAACSIIADTARRRAWREPTSDAKCDSTNLPLNK
jgi:hypothetical protein